MNEPIYNLYLITFMTSAFLAYRFFQAWQIAEIKQPMTLKVSILFGIITLIFTIASIDTNHRFEWVIMLLCIIAEFQFMPEVLTRRDIMIILIFSAFIVARIIQLTLANS